jgi:TRAP-type C4-dicarboxylate transport system substrate-binding protein
MLKAAVSGVALAIAIVATAATAQTKITYGSWAPDTYPNSVAVTAFFDKVAKATGGKLSFETFYGGAVVNIRTSLPGVKDRLVDAAYITGSLFQQQTVIDNWVTQHAAMTADTRAVTAAMNETLLLNCPECQAEWAKNGIVSLAYLADAPFYMQCRGEPTGLDYYKGKQIRGVGPFTVFAQQLGGVPVNTAPGEVFEAMQKGVVACAIGGGFWQRAYSLWDVAKYVVDMPLGQYNNGSIMAINRDVWKGLTADQRKAFMDNLAFLTATGTFAQHADDKAAREGGAQRGVQWIKPTAEYVAFVEKFRETEIGRVIKEEGSKPGMTVALAERLTASLQANIRKWTAILQETGDDQAKFEAALQREIFSKVKEPT